MLPPYPLPQIAQSAMGSDGGDEDVAVQNALTHPGVSKRWGVQFTRPGSALRVGAAVPADGHAGCLCPSACRTCLPSLLLPPNRSRRCSRATHFPAAFPLPGWAATNLWLNHYYSSCPSPHSCPAVPLLQEVEALQLEQYDQPPLCAANHVWLDRSTTVLHVLSLYRRWRRCSWSSTISTCGTLRR